MNVAFDPWIPVVNMHGKTGAGEAYATCSLRATSFWIWRCIPHERVSLMRLFLCVAHAALDGPKDYDEWCEVPKRLPEAVQKYLTVWKECFELFDPDKPWLQVAGLSKSAQHRVSRWPLRIGRQSRSSTFPLPPETILHFSIIVE